MSDLSTPGGLDGSLDASDDLTGSISLGGTLASGSSSQTLMSGDLSVSVSLVGTILTPQTAPPQAATTYLELTDTDDSYTGKAGYIPVVNVDEDGLVLTTIEGGVQGPPGPQGETGATGPQGPIGLTGPEGPQGPQGEQGVPGEDGAQGIQGPQGVEGAAGPQGEQGPIGETGPQGEQGPIGLTGDTGPTGATGPEGPEGPIGLTGPQGEQGEQGIQGVQGEPGPEVHLVESVNGQQGVVVLDTDDITEGVTNLYYPSADATKLAGIEAGAEVNVNADWTSVVGDSAIFNKPTIPTVDVASVGAAINSANEMTTPAEDDKLAVLEDAASFTMRWLSWSNLKAAFILAFNALYVALSGNQTIAGIKTFSSSILVTVTGAAASVRLSGDAGNPRSLVATTGGSSRWSVSVADASPESGSNAGSDFTATRFSDAGAYLDQAWTLSRQTGHMGIGVSPPQGRIHARDGAGGFIFATKTGVAGTVVTIIPDGTGDVTGRISANVVAVDAGGSSISTVIALTPGNSSGLNTAAGTITFAVTAGGAFTVQRTAGATTYTVSVNGTWI